MLLNSILPSTLTNNHLFGIVVSVGAYVLGYFLYKKTKIIFLSPFFVGFIAVIIFVAILKVPVEDFNKGGDFLTMFIAPTTICLAFTMYIQLKTLKKCLIPVIIGTLVGAFISVFSSYLLSSLFNFEDIFTLSVLPRSSTMAIAMEISAKNGGAVGITIASVMVTGLLGGLLYPSLLKLFKVKDKIAIGVGLGTAAHAMGVAKASEYGELEAAMAGVSMTLTGFFIVVIMLFF